MDETNSIHRLPKNVTPSHYQLEIQPDLEKFTFEGKVVVALKINQSTRSITLNCLDIEIESVQFQTAEGLTIPSKTIEHQKNEERVIIHFDGEILQCSGNLTIKYQGHLRDDLKGFYRSAQSTGEDKQYAAVTHFEPTGARRAFPCWDEPSVKCTFDITLIVPQDRTALSNMHVIETKTSETDESLKIVKFATTPEISTYIIAFIVGSFDYVETKAENGVLVRVYTSVGKAESGRYALEFAKDALVWLENYFQVPYGLSKIDLIGIADFGIGAMENWGLVTYRERYLLVDENTAASIKQFVTEIIAHEFTHNWFGNLVTMKWWTDLWLKEGFANFMAALCVDGIHPEFDIMTRFLINEIIVAQSLDALENSHPIEVPVHNPAEINEIFDRISYSKGASILRMLHQYVGDQAFRQGLTSYLKKFQFSNTVTDDLWNELETSSKKPVREMMTTWTSKKGFPVVNISRQSINDDKQVLKLTQKKFCIGYRDQEGYTWQVPINLCCRKPNKDDIVTSSMSDVEFLLYLDHGSDTKWLKLNYGERDFYRVQYESDLLDELIPAIKDMSLPPIDRLGIQNDLFNLACGGYATTVEYITLLKAYVDESNPIVWTDILLNLRKLLSLFEMTSVNEEFKSFVTSLLLPLSQRIGMENSDKDCHSKRILRNSVYSLLGVLGVPAIVTKFKAMFSNMVNENTPIDPEIRSAVYTTVSYHGDITTFEQLKNVYLSTDIADERIKLMYAMGKTKDSDVLEKYLNFAISDDVRKQDTTFALAGCFTSHESRVISWNFVKHNWRLLIDDRCAGGHAVRRLIETAVKDFTALELLKDAEKFFNENPVEHAERATNQTLETVRNNIAWLDRLSDVCSIFQ